MRNSIFINAILVLCFISCKTDKKESATTETIIENNVDVETTTSDTSSEIKITPIEHATMVLEYKNVVVYVDPVGGAEQFDGQKPPSIILVTDIHGDHFNEETLSGILGSAIKIIAPGAVAELLPKPLRDRTLVLNNSQNRDYTFDGVEINIEAVPMYNLREEALKFHEKGRGNGYILTMGGKRIYISGDTEDIPEMRNLKDIDMAFVCMNLPYTMNVESAASAVLDFKPKQVYPYHYRGQGGLSDVEKFKAIVNDKNDAIEVVQLDWYK